MANVVTTECSSCFATVTIDVESLTVTTKVPSNGKRGAGFVGAHDVVESATSDGHLVLWDCGICGYADSTYEDPDTRRELA